MTGNQLVGTNGRIELTLDGLTFARSTSAASSRGVGRLHQVEWARIQGAELTRSGKGKPVVQVQVSDAGSSPGGRHDPHSVKLKRGMVEEAVDFVNLVNDEVATRRRWAAAADEA